MREFVLVANRTQAAPEQSRELGCSPVCLASSSKKTASAVSLVGHVPLKGRSTAEGGGAAAAHGCNNNNGNDGADKHGASHHAAHQG